MTILCQCVSVNLASPRHSRNRPAISVRYHQYTPHSRSGQPVARSTASHVGTVVHRHTPGRTAASLGPQSTRRACIRPPLPWPRGVRVATARATSCDVQRDDREYGAMRRCYRERRVRRHIHARAGSRTTRRGLQGRRGQAKAQPRVPTVPPPLQSRRRGARGPAITRLCYMPRRSGEEIGRHRWFAGASDWFASRLRARLWSGQDFVAPSSRNPPAHSAVVARCLIAGRMTIAASRAASTGLVASAAKQSACQESWSVLAAAAKVEPSLPACWPHVSRPEI